MKWSELLDPKSTMPLGRDSAYHHILVLQEPGTPVGTGNAPSRTFLHFDNYRESGIHLEPPYESACEYTELFDLAWLFSNRIDSALFIGGGAGLGSTMNVPIRPRTARPEYLRRYRDALDRAFEAARPDFVLVSAGFDCLAGDPLGDLTLEPDDLHAMASALVGRAAESCGGRVVACFEGGYHPERTARAALQVIRALARIGPLGETLG